MNNFVAACSQFFFALFVDWIKPQIQALHLSMHKNLDFFGARLLMYHSSLFGDITHHIHFVHPYSPHIEKHLHFELSSCKNEKTIRNSEKLFHVLE